jgi:hypothetical protein
MKRPVLFLLLTAASLLAADFAAEGNLWWSHIQFLADDKLEGRQTGSDGYRKAVEYVQTAFERTGLKPAGTDGYQQPIQFETRMVADDVSSLELVRDDKTETLVLGQDATLSPRGNLAPAAEAAMVFVGYGMCIPEVHSCDLDGISLRGKVAVYVNGPGPVDAPGNLKSHYGSGGERWAALRKAGAVGIATIANPRMPQGNQAAGGTADGATGAGGRGGRGGGGRGPAQPTFLLADKNLQDGEGMTVAIAINRQGAEKFFAGSGHTYDEIIKLAQANAPLPKFPLQPLLRSKVTLKRDNVTASNVAGLLPGSDDKLKNEYVVMSAHLDHLGVGRAVNGDNLYNGAMDDASGIASVLEIARLMKESGHPLKRSVIFLAVTAEEKGELGSRYFAAHPTVAAKQIVADINLDMFLPLYALKVIEVQGLTESTLGETVKTAAADFDVAVQVDREPEQNRFIRSDQYSFIKEGVPSLAFKFGYEFGSPEEKLRKDWVRDIYHKPSDDLNQPIDKEAAAKFDRIIADLLERVANDPNRPQWHADSFFKRFAK